ncbi:MAG: HAMP domain-containing protein [Methyloprofundus sp.]|nr:HAMP domain-containing protein [Methyloprofundus sp.]
MSDAVEKKNVSRSSTGGGMLSFIGDISLTQKLILMLVVPLLTLVFYTVSEVRRAQDVVQENESISEVVRFSVVANALVHELQKERGLSAGYIGSKGSQFKTVLPEQQQLTNVKISDLKSFLQGFDTENLPQTFSKKIELMLLNMAKIESKRQNVLSLNLSLKETLDYYTNDVNAYLLELIGNMPKLSSIGDISVMGTAYFNFIESKERAGIERAVLANTFSKNEFGLGVYEQFLSLMTIQNTYIKEFLQFATTGQVDAYQKAMQNKSVDETERLRSVAQELSVSGGFNIAPAYWWTVQTDKINLLKQIEDGISTDLSSMANSYTEVAAAKLNQALLISVISSLATILLVFLVAKNILGSLGELGDTVNIIEEGDYTARSGLTNKDEFGVFARAFNQLLDDRVSSLVESEKEGEQLNESIIGLLMAVGQLSQRDLTAKVPVQEDVTGAVADALNLFSEETSNVLKEVTQVSEQVNSAALKAQELSSEVLIASDADKQQVQQTVQELSQMAVAMRDMATEAQGVSKTSEKATETTSSALDTVTETVNSIMQIRDTIRETEKRIKRLGERSQEIGGTVNLINNIAERTHILSLNASMHAASAGEAGRGFMVVADEIQRLAENSREATAQIETLVKNIQVETTDTAAIMNTVISQVVEGSNLAEKAGQKMQETQTTTADLVRSIQHISVISQVQAESSNALRERSEEVQKSVATTAEKMNAQAEENRHLVEFAKALTASVGVFKLPA